MADKANFTKEEWMLLRTAARDGLKAKFGDSSQRHSKVKAVDSLRQISALLD